jgi:hypothetical protein
MGKAGQTGIGPKGMHPRCERISLVSIPFVLLFKENQFSRTFWGAVIAKTL